MFKLKIFIPKLKISSHIFYIPPSPVSVAQTQPTTTETKTGLQVVIFMDMVGQFDGFRHYGYMLGMYSTQAGILQEVSQVVLSGLLQCLDCAHLEAQMMLPISLCFLMDQVCEGSLMNEDLHTLLVLAYLMESHCPWPVPLGLL